MTASKVIHWAERRTWVPWLSRRLRSRLKADALARMREADTSRLYADDSDWLRLLDRHLTLGVEHMQAEVAADLGRRTVRTCHGCRTEDAGSYHREGLRSHDRAALIAQLRTLVDGDARLHNLKQRLDARIADICSAVDESRCFVVLDPRFLLEHAAHYLIYGSELLCGILGEWNRQVLLERGAPTLIHVDLPLSAATDGDRRDLAKLMLREWTRLSVWRDVKTVLSVDFTFILREAPPAWIAGHSHPASMIDPLEQMRTYRPTRTSCAECASI